eukprot:12795353-Prorocentrum_lima.AAC.1
MQELTHSKGFDQWARRQPLPPGAVHLARVRQRARHRLLIEQLPHEQRPDDANIWRNAWWASVRGP